jgi:hypothetical protein
VTTLEELSKLEGRLALVQAELRGTKHYKDEMGNRLILYPDGSYGIEVNKQALDKLVRF